MPTFDRQSRDQLRRSYADAWSKRRAGAPLLPLEALICDVIELHPEYQDLLDDGDRVAQFEPGPSENPFLHMGLHIAVREQLKVDRPPGVGELYQGLIARYGEAHAAEHALMEALQETLWTAQREGVAPDAGRYLALARRRLSKR
jgi:hypothetical protein